MVDLPAFFGFLRYKGHRPVITLLERHIFDGVKGLEARGKWVMILARENTAEKQTVMIDGACFQMFRGIWYNVLISYDAECS